MSQQGVGFSKNINKRKKKDRQKLGPILENIVVQKLKFLKNVNNKKPAPKVIFFNTGLSCSGRFLVSVFRMLNKQYIVFLI